MAEMIMPYYNTIEISQEEYDRLRSLEKLVSEMGFDDGLVKEDASNEEHGLSKTEDLD